MATISKAFLQIIEETLAENPLSEKEIRRIKGFSNWFVSLSPEINGDSGIIKVVIKGVPAYAYRNFPGRGGD